MIRLNDEQHWLYAAVNHETNELLHTTLEPTTYKDIAHAFFAELREKHDASDIPRNLRFLVSRKPKISDESAGTPFLRDANKTHSVLLTPCLSLMALTH